MSLSLSGLGLASQHGLVCLPRMAWFAFTAWFENVVKVDMRVRAPVLLVYKCCDVICIGHT